MSVLPLKTNRGSNRGLLSARSLPLGIISGQEHRESTLSTMGSKGNNRRDNRKRFGDGSRKGTSDRQQDGRRGHGSGRDHRGASSNDNSALHAHYNLYPQTSHGVAAAAGLPTLPTPSPPRPLDGDELEESKKPVLEEECQRAAVRSLTSVLYHEPGWGPHKATNFYYRRIAQKNNWVTSFKRASVSGVIGLQVKAEHKKEIQLEVAAANARENVKQEEGQADGTMKQPPKEVKAPAVATTGHSTKDERGGIGSGNSSNPLDIRSTQSSYNFNRGVPGVRDEITSHLSDHQEDSFPPYVYPVPDHIGKSTLHAVFSPTISSSCFLFFFRDQLLVVLGQSPVVCMNIG